MASAVLNHYCYCKQRTARVCEKACSREDAPFCDLGARHERGTPVERHNEAKGINDGNGKPSPWSALSRPLQIFFAGLLIAFWAFSGLSTLRGFHASWTLIVALLISIAELFFLPRRKSNPASGQLIGLVCLPLLAVIFHFRHQIWAPMAVALLFAGFLLPRFKSTRRSHPIPQVLLLVGCSIAGIYPYWFPWPNEQRCLLAVIGAGATIAMLGAWLILRYLWTGQPVLPLEAQQREQEELAFARALHWMVGKVDHTQIFSAELNQRIQNRYRTEIDCLHRLGFQNAFCDAEFIPAIRFLNPLLALTLVAMSFKKAVLTLGSRLRIGSCHPVFLSPRRDSFAFGELIGLGVSFYTTFQDGTLLVTKNYGDDDPPISPLVVVRRYKGASIETAWANHQTSIQQLRQEGKSILCDMSHRAYAEISYRETNPDDSNAASPLFTKTQDGFSLSR